MNLHTEELACGQGKIGLARLDKPEALNALSMEMIEALHAKLLEWQSRQDIALIWLEGSGPKAFCAGGDIVRLYQSIQNKDSYFKDFFEKEYRLDYAIHNSPKPVICWAHGIVMGGGMGLMQGASMRIVTEKTMMAMPEIGIGLYPDVGATAFLQKCPHGVGIYLGLTGTRLNGTEAKELRLADVFISSELREKVLERLCAHDWQVGSSKKDLQAALERSLMELEVKSEAAKPASRLDWDWMVKLANFPDPLSLSLYLKDQKELSPWAEHGRKTVLTGSPTSAALIFEQFKRGKSRDLKKAFQMEWLVSVNCCLHHDFPEGIRALLIDRDNTPRWSPSEIAELKSDTIQSYFELPDDVSQNPLDNL
jgi:enoyl-CoA hydratase/carnithine racemase